MNISRRQFVRALSSAVALGLAGPWASARADTPPPGLPQSARNETPTRVAVAPTAGYQVAMLQTARAHLLRTAQNCVLNKATGQPLYPSSTGEYATNGDTWVRPSEYYTDLYSRDSFWILAALQNRSLLEAIRAQFHDDQSRNPDGHIATAMRSDLKVPPGRDSDDESTLMDVLREWEWTRLGGDPNLESLTKSQQFIQAHVHGGLYVTMGEPASGAYHYWADTFRAGVAQAITYCQGLFCVALEALDRMGMPVAAGDKQAAARAYAGLTSAPSGSTLVQRRGSATLDISALAGDALSLYYFDTPLLPDSTVKVTLDHLVRVSAVYMGDVFVGFRVLSDFDGWYLAPSHFVGSDSVPGNYHNGGSWLLYDALALYSAARRGVPRAAELLKQRVLSELERSGAFHEFTRTSPTIEDVRSHYGWNGFVANLIA